MVERDIALPGLQLRTFLGLLKRRRWLILPMALLGILVGAATSFFIPRFYRAQTQFQIKNVAIETTTLGPDEDPMEAEVKAARYTITTELQFLKAARSLQWPEFFSADPDDKTVRGLVESGRKRIRVYLVTSQKGAGHVGLSYADKDPGRAAAMANQLRILWLEGRIKKVKGELEENLDQAVEMLAKAQRQYDTASGDLRDYRKANSVRPDATANQGPFSGRNIFDVRDDLDDTIREKESAQAALGKRIAQLDKRLAATPPTLEEAGVDPLSNNPEVQVLILRIARRQQNLNGGLWKPEHPHRDRFEAELKRWQEQLRLLREQLTGGAAAPAQPNPAYTSLYDDLEKAKLELAELDSSLEMSRGHREAVVYLCRMHPEIAARVDRLKLALSDAEERRVSRQRDFDAQEKKLKYFNTRIHYEVTSEAYPPPQPNDPATWIITLIGFGIGLGVAVSLIVLTEVLRISFRSVEEAERVLPVPVLGAVSHLETEEENRLLRRRRLILTGGSLMVLLAVATIVGIYFYDASRLPYLVVRVLDRVFGVG